MPASSTHLQESLFALRDGRDFHPTAPKMPIILDHARRVTLLLETSRCGKTRSSATTSSEVAVHERVLQRESAAGDDSRE